MCGRFVNFSSVNSIADEFSVDNPDITLQPSYNIAPGQDILIVIGDEKNRLRLCRWGFIPPWAKDPKTGYKMINARGETVADKASFRAAFRKGRCLVVANGFYEWKRRGKKKVPLYVHLKKREMFGLAGLYSLWQSPDGQRICTTTIITATANELLQPVHDRMPVIIARDRESAWLDPGIQDRDALLSMLTSYPRGEMALHEVSSLVNTPSHNAPDCIAPVRGNARTEERGTGRKRD